MNPRSWEVELLPPISTTSHALSGATFVLQGIYGLSPQGYSYAFALNSFGFMLFGFLASRAAERWSLQGTLTTGIAMVVAGSSGILITALLALPLASMAGSLLILVSGVAVTTPPATSLALENHRDVAGSASALLGAARFAFGGITAPLVGLAGAACWPPSTRHPYLAAFAMSLSSSASPGHA